MTKHNFNFPQISFKNSTTISANSVLPFFVDEDKNVSFNFDTSFVPDAILDQIKKSKQSTSLSHIVNNKIVQFHFVKFDEKMTDPAKIVALAKAVKSANADSIDVVTIGFDFDLKHLTSQLLVTNANHWNAKSKQKDDLKSSSICIVSDNNNYTQDALDKGVALAISQSNAIRLVEMPSNYLTPDQFLLEVASFVSTSNNPKLSFSSISGKQLQEQGFNSMYSVAKGSSETPHLITIKYMGDSNPDAQPVVLVGKGLTFDSGGISIKPSKGMGRMKGDMAGAATALASILYAANTNSKSNIVAILACCENMPDASSLKPGDVITAKNGTTIEVEDTDAEGRLVLADALCHAQSFNPRTTIDFATLTGACISALGHVHSGLFSDDQSLVDSLSSIGKLTGDSVWHLPMGDEYSHFLDSSVADINNLCLGQGAGATNGAIFLKHFAPSNSWVHLDIAGTSELKSATGRPVPLISNFIDSL